MMKPEKGPESGQIPTSSVGFSMLTAPASPFRQASVDDLTQLRPAERAALADYLARLREKYADRILHVILYGSRARGEGDAESDVDVLVVVEDGDWRFLDAVADESVEPWLQHNVVLSPIVWSREWFDQQAQWRALLFRNIENDGFELWTGKSGPPFVATA